MGQKLNKLDTRLIKFIKDQKIFFVATAAQEGRVNVSPKGHDTLHIVDESKIIWLNLTGSGNETAAHILNNNRITIMFCAFDGPPLILRIYGTAAICHPGEQDYENYITCFKHFHGTRQIFEVSIDLVQTSCGMAVPLYDYHGQREQLENWAEKKGSDGLNDYWQEKNTVSLDGLPTDIQKSNSNFTSE